MGMAASQARYLELTARKTDVEYQGQQINQQRTSLANESAGLFSQLMDLSVPTAPSSTNFTKTIYTFNNGNNDCTIDNVQTLNGDPNNNATVTYHYKETDYTGIATRRTDLGAKLVTDSGVSNYWLTDGSATNPTNKTKLTQVSLSDTNIADEEKALVQICKDNPTSKLASDLGYRTDTQTIDTGKIGNAYYYTNNSGVSNYYGITDLTAAVAVVPSGAATSLSSYYAANLSKNISATSKAYVTTASSGRYSNITLDGTSSPFGLTATTTTDANAYQDAMNEYQYRQQLYQQNVNDINAKTSAIELEDRTLQLKLTQLDTEQQALSTEMDSVKKVIDKNIESTFKTFSS